MLRFPGHSIWHNGASLRHTRELGVPLEPLLDDRLPPRRALFLGHQAKTGALVQRARGVEARERVHAHLAMAGAATERHRCVHEPMSLTAPANRIAQHEPAQM